MLSTKAARKLDGAIKVAEIRKKEMIQEGNEEGAMKMDFHIAELMSLKS